MAQKEGAREGEGGYMARIERKYVKHREKLFPGKQFSSRKRVDVISIQSGYNQFSIETNQTQILVDTFFCGHLFNNLANLFNNQPQLLQ